MDVLRGKFVIDAHEESFMSNEIIRGSDYLGLFFSASWSPVCRTFLPRLKDVYEEARLRDIKLELIFVPSDRDVRRSTRFFVKSHGPWYALADPPLALALRKKLQVFKIPSLVILKKNGSVVTKTAVGDIEALEDPLTHWFPEANPPLVEDGGDGNLHADIFTLEMLLEMMKEKEN